MESSSKSEQAYRKEGWSEGWPFFFGYKCSSNNKSADWELFKVEKRKKA
jgi:hypothetical protein